MAYKSFSLYKHHITNDLPKLKELAPKVYALLEAEAKLYQSLDTLFLDAAMYREKDDIWLITCYNGAENDSEAYDLHVTIENGKVIETIWTLTDRG